jgi:hypothetical protein
LRYFAAVRQRRFSVGDKVSASRDETGEGHEPGVVVDSYELIIGEERRAMVVVEFEDGERRYLTSTARNVVLVEAKEDEQPEAEPAGEPEPEPEPEREPGPEAGAEGGAEADADAEPVDYLLEEDDEPEGRP